MGAPAEDVEALLSCATRDLRTTRLFPTPASPVSATTRPSPRAAAARCSPSAARASSRCTSSGQTTRPVAPRIGGGRRTGGTRSVGPSERGMLAACVSTSYTWTDWVTPFSFHGPRSRIGATAPVRSSERTVSVTRTRPPSACCASRAARITAEPTYPPPSSTASPLLTPIPMRRRRSGCRLL